MKMKYRWLMTTIVLTCGVLGVGFVQLAAQQPWGGGTVNATVDQFQRSYEVLNNNELAKSGVARGETIYFYKCWMCHNPGAAGDKSGLVGPLLDDISERLTTDEALATKIKNGGPRMPSFRHNFTDADIADLLAYLKSPTCCYDNQDPPNNPHYNADTVRWPVPTALKGGPRGVVRAANGHLLEGIKVQMILPNAVRTTVFTNAEGQYEFPALQSGSYTLRIATPLPYKAYAREGVAITGAHTLDDIVLDPVPSPQGGGYVKDAFPPTPEVMAQLSGSEWLWNLSGTMQEKMTFTKGCATGCHSYENVLRNRYDERSWRLIVERMKNVPQGGPGRAMDRNSEADAERYAEIDAIAKWLVKVRGPESKDDPVRLWARRPTGAATRVVITEYEVNRRFLNLHDVCGDAKGNIWFNSWHAPHVGYLDPRTGIIKEYKLPPMASGRPLVGTHACRVDDTRGYVWFSQGPSQPSFFVDRAFSMFRLNMNTGEVKQFPNSPIGVNFGLAPDGFLWYSQATEGGSQEIVRVNPRTGEVANAYPRENYYSYQHAVSDDGRFVAGGSPVGPGYNTAWMLDVAEGKVYETTSPNQDHGAARGGFDPFGDAWFGGRGGPLVQLVNEIDEGKGVHTRLHWPPTPLFPYSDFYTATADKNGEIWGGIMHGRGFVRFNPKTDHWVVYENPEPSSLNRYQWIDNSTTPPTIWYPDFQTQMFVRIQPLE
jgi:streptogramin lyase/mono/diheme cytochrome c family protein